VAGALSRSAALAAASVAAVLLTVEGGLRLVRYTPRRFHAAARLVDPRWRLLLDCYPSNPRGYFDIDLRRPERRERYGHLAPLRYESLARRTPYAIESRYNSLRFRDVEFLPKPAGVRRVMVLGDSFTEGQGVKEADTYPRVLEARLNASGGARWEVRNCGRRGADFPLLFELFEQVLAFDPDVVVYGMVLNDADQSDAFHAQQTYVNVGFWSTVPVGLTDGETNRLIERKVSELRGHKSLYSDSYYSPEEFSELYGGETYRTVKKRYDPDSRLLDLYAKAVQRR